MWEETQNVDFTEAADYMCFNTRLYIYIWIKYILIGKLQYIAYWCVNMY